MMKRNDNETRAALERFIESRGRGAVNEIAEAAGVSRQWIKAFRDDAHAPDGDTLGKLAVALKVKGYLGTAKSASTEARSSNLRALLIRSFESAIKDCRDPFIPDDLLGGQMRRLAETLIETCDEFRKSRQNLT